MTTATVQLTEETRKAAEAFWQAALDAVIDEKQQFRAEHCGAYFSDTKVENGRLKTVKMWCGLFRLCPQCRDKREEHFRARVTHALEFEGPLMYWEVKSKNERAFRTKLQRRHKLFLRFPMRDDYTGFFFQACDAGSPECKEINEADLMDLRWHEIIFTPPRRKVTGGLGRLPKVEKDRADCVLCTVSTVKTMHVPDTVRKASWLEALAQTADLMPASLEEALEFARIRTMAYRDRLAVNMMPVIAAQRGISETEAYFLSADEYVSTFERSTYVDPAKIDWTGSVSHIPNEFSHLHDSETHPPLE